ncbi:MAG: UDP-2,3-diacylglucosamine diphosphatase LpxI [Henriciella sp.]|nr:UDP-2,3-diacylglucosamine diphosphatase LpxI [Henriciella sp.]
MSAKQPPLGLIAGLGDLPVRVASAAAERGQGVYVVRLKGFVEPALDHLPGEVIGFAEVGKIYKAFRAAGCKEICFAGNVKRPDFSALKPDMKGMLLLPKVLAAARKGDDALLRTVVEAIEEEGFKVVGAQEASGQLLVGDGLLAGAAPGDEALADLRKGAEIAAATGRMDIGQGVIVCNGLVLCVEAQEGTDAMLQRCAALDTSLRGTPEARRGVLVKRPKPIQDHRIDWPTIGVRTVEGAAEAGLTGIGVESGGALILDQEAVFARAEALGLFIYSFPKDWA